MRSEPGSLEPPTAETTIAVLIGASEYPRKPVWSNPVLRTSAYGFRDYMRSETGLALTPGQVLDLFDDAAEPTGQLLRIEDFLAATASTSQDLILYYVGHGGFYHEEYYLGVQCTQHDREDITTIESRKLAQVIRRGFGRKRVYVILDSCFAASAASDWQGNEIEAAVRKMAQPLPRQGTAFLAAASKYDVTRAPRTERYTIFTGAVLEALRHGVDSTHPKMSMYELYEEVRDLLRRRETDVEGRPELHLPSQAEGDISRLRLFPNATYLRAEAHRVRAERIEAAEKLATRARDEVDARARDVAAARAQMEAAERVAASARNEADARVRDVATARTQMEAAEHAAASARDEADARARDVTAARTQMESAERATASVRDEATARTHEVDAIRTPVDVRVPIFEVEATRTEIEVRPPILGVARSPAIRRMILGFLGFLFAMGFALSISQAICDAPFKTRNELANPAAQAGNGPTVGSGGAIGSAGLTGSDSNAAPRVDGANTTPKLPATPPRVDTVIGASVEGARIEIVGTNQSGPAPFTAKLEKGKPYKARVAAPTFLALTLDIEGGANKQIAKLVAKPRVISIQTDPPGALIFIDSGATGHATPFDVELTEAQAAKKTVRVKIRKTGFLTLDRVVEIAKLDEDDTRMVVATINKKLVPLTATPTIPPAGATTTTDPGLASAPEGSASKPEGPASEPEPAFNKPQ